MNATSPPAAAARFRSAYEATYADVLRFVQRRVPHDRAEDVVAETMLVAWRRVDALPADLDSQRAWLFGIARNCLLNDRRGARRGEALAVRIASTVSPPTAASDTAAEVDHRVDLARAWAALGPAEQEVLALTVFDGLDSACAGEVLQISAGAYRLRLSRARRALRAHLDDTPVPDRQELTS